MSTKITLTLTHLDDDHPNAAGMAETIGLLTQIGIVPTKKVALTIECKDEDAENYTDDIDAALSGRPMGIEVVIKTTTERHVERRRMTSVTPMDAIEGFAQRHGAKVELVSSDREPL